MARVAAALVAVLAWAGLAIQFRATSSLGYAPVEALWVMLRYFTVLTNLLFALTLSAVAANRRVSPSVIGGVTLAMVLVGMVYMTLLHGLVELSGGALLADTLLHKVTPVAALLWWLAFARKGGLGWGAPVAWALYPLAYFLYALVRGRAEGKYAYPFINVAQLGAVAVVLNAVMIAGCFLVAGLAMVALDRRLAADGSRPLTSPRPSP